MTYSKHCPGCNAVFEEDENDPIHPYIGASKGCWKFFTEVLAWEGENFGYPKIHRLLVDSYCAQHPGVKSRKSIQSVAIHLIALYMAVEKQIDLKVITKSMDRALSKGAIFEWLEPPEDMGNITILDIKKAKSLKEYEDILYKWARSILKAYSKHHDIIKTWYEKFFY
ncbi:MAG: hypothetical protein KR126chlam6_00906 [Candidatus Anoxychlamydiales bacterium]|nr:hypothetical protein [Candidatus Anoxychlamydiales bacterium]